MDNKTTNDPENYYKMSEPFESPDAANEALSKFHEELGKLRKKHKITDVLIVTHGSIRYEDGKVGHFMNHSAYGSSRNQESMAAYVYGQTQAEHRELINKLLAGKTE